MCEAGFGFREKRRIGIRFLPPRHDFFSLDAGALNTRPPTGTGKLRHFWTIPRYDFNWQPHYEYKQPKLIPQGSTLKITAVFDNSPGNKANPDPSKLVRWGSQTVDEMMIGYIEYFRPLN